MEFDKRVGAKIYKRGEKLPTTLEMYQCDVVTDDGKTATIYTVGEPTIINCQNIKKVDIKLDLENFLRKVEQENEWKI